MIRTDESIKGYYNVCQYRGHRLKDGCGNSGKSIYCPAPMAQRYRCRPDDNDSEKYIFEVWWLMRFPSSEGPGVAHSEYRTLKDFKEKNLILEQHFSIFLANQKGANSRKFARM